MQKQQSKLNNLLFFSGSYNQIQNTDKCCCYSTCSNSLCECHPQGFESYQVQSRLSRDSFESNDRVSSDPDSGNASRRYSESASLSKSCFRRRKTAAFRQEDLNSDSIEEDERFHERGKRRSYDSNQPRYFVTEHDIDRFSPPPVTRRKYLPCTPSDQRRLPFDLSVFDQIDEASLNGTFVSCDALREDLSDDTRHIYDPEENLLSESEVDDFGDKYRSSAEPYFAFNDSSNTELLTKSKFASHRAVRVQSDQTDNFRMKSISTPLRRMVSTPSSHNYYPRRILPSIELSNRNQICSHGSEVFFQASPTSARPFGNQSASKKNSLVPSGRACSEFHCDRQDEDFSDDENISDLEQQALCNFRRVSDSNYHSQLRSETPERKRKQPYLNSRSLSHFPAPFFGSDETKQEPLLKSSEESFDENQDQDEDSQFFRQRFSESNEMVDLTEVSVPFSRRNLRSPDSSPNVTDFLRSRKNSRILPNCTNNVRGKRSSQSGRFSAKDWK